MRYITVDCSVAASQNGFCSYKFSFHKKTNNNQGNKWQHTRFFITLNFCHRSVVKQDHYLYDAFEICKNRLMVHPLQNPPLCYVAGPNECYRSPRWGGGGVAAARNLWKMGEELRQEYIRGDEHLLLLSYLASTPPPFLPLPHLATSALSLPLSLLVFLLSVLQFKPSFPNWKEKGRRGFTVSD